jgi:hypothetical protein
MSILLYQPIVSKPGIPVMLRISDKSNLTWDAVTQDTAGNLEVVGHYDVAVSLPTADLSASGVALKTVSTTDATPSMSLLTLLTGVSGDTFKLWARTQDQVGNISAWSIPLDVIVDRTPPKAPVNLQVK